MTRCKHEDAIIKYDIDGLPDPLELSWRECGDCGAWLSLGPSNDRIPPDEMDLAEYIADVHLWWEPGRERTERIAFVIDTYASRPITEHAHESPLADLVGR